MFNGRIQYAGPAGGGRGPIEALVASPYEERFGMPSPNGRWLAFVSNQSGTQEVYAGPLQAGGEQVQISQGGATEPVWSPDGRELFYRSFKSGTSELIAANLRTAPKFTVVSQTSTRWSARSRTRTTTSRPTDRRSRWCAGVRGATLW